MVINIYQELFGFHHILRDYILDFISIPAKKTVPPFEFHRLIDHNPFFGYMKKMVHKYILDFIEQ
jgi:hypothetical protein